MDSLQHPVTALDFLVFLLWLVLLAIGFLTVAVLIQVWFILRELGFFLRDAQNDLRPMLKDLPEITHHVESLAAKADSGAEALEVGFQELQKTPSRFKAGVSSLIGGIRKSFSQGT